MSSYPSPLPPPPLTEEQKNSIAAPEYIGPPSGASTNSDTPITSVPRSTADKIGGVLSSILKAAGGDTSPMDQNIQQHYNQRIAQAQMDQKHTQLYATILAHAHQTVGPNAPYGVDPTTGQPMTKDQYDYYTNAYQSSMAAYEKSAGVNKQTKGMIQKAKMFMQHIVGSLPGQPSGVGAQKPGMPAPPQPTASAAGGAAGPASASSGAPAAAAGPSFPPPPPAMLQQGLDDAHTLDLKRRELEQADAEKLKQSTAEIEQAKTVAKEAGFKEGTPEFNEFVFGIKPGVVPPGSKVSKVETDDKGNAIAVMEDGTTKKLDFQEAATGLKVSKIDHDAKGNAVAIMTDGSTKPLGYRASVKPPKSAASSSPIKVTQLTSSMSSISHDLNSARDKQAQMVRQLQTQNQKGWSVWHPLSSVGKDQVAEAQSQLDNLNAAVAHFDGKRGAILKQFTTDQEGAMEALDRVQSEAQDIADNGKPAKGSGMGTPPKSSGTIDDEIMGAIPRH